MEGRFWKEFVIALVFLSIVAYGIWAYMEWEDSKIVIKMRRVKGVPEDLKQKIAQIDESIGERKDFVFEMQKGQRDPLEQNLIVKTKVDLERQWREMVESQMRLAGTMEIDGVKLALFEYKGRTQWVEEGGQYEGFTIQEVTDGSVQLALANRTRTLNATPVPEKPSVLKEDDSARELNW